MREFINILGSMKMKRGFQKKSLLPALVILSVFGFGNCQKLSDKLLKIDPFIGETAPPKVLFSNPTTGAQNLPTSQSFSIGFSRAMNVNSCQTAFTMSPATSGFFSNTNGLILTFSPTAALNPGTYTFTLTKSCEDPNGMDIENPFSASVAVGGSASGGSLGSNPTVTNMYVYAGTTSACNTAGASLTDFLNGSVLNACMGDPNQNQIIINFSRAMDPNSTNSAISISPSVSGSFVWSSGSILTFTPDNALALNQRYTFTVGGSAADSGGILMKQSVQGSFLVGSGNATPTVTSLTVLTGSQAGCQAGIGTASNILTSNVTNACLGDPTTNTVVFNFGLPMNTQSVQNAISFSPAISGSYTWSNGNQTLTLVSDSTLGFGTRYTVAIGTGALSANLVPLQQAIGASFVAGGINPSPSVQSVGLVSQPGCATSFPGSGSSTGGNWSMGFCWWDYSQQILSPSAYQFRGGDDGLNDAAACADQTTDDFRIIFNNYMDARTTMNAISLNRITGTSTVIRLATWVWRDCQLSFPYGCRVLDLEFSEIESSCGGSSAFGASGDYNMTRAGFDFTSAIPYTVIATDPNGPVYTLQVANSATDVNGRQLLTPFSFSFVSQ
ncbi:Ig-like protein [Leptospira fainei serovar Hurstbridge str. BUT 6]|uniref:Ig-like protein n=1 Tax=Leptospira fainei serovar Hurstbridge str. BUT 6 TaxID=1193011 RepID=S3W2P6_9LEPT|nr:Ig-like domain-containing protein [Leptospira fainei]EPG74532.1 Ig-like protein [Leptospira fainei serovar Hurstbridge str. BUT 6]